MKGEVNFEQAGANSLYLKNFDTDESNGSKLGMAQALNSRFSFVFSWFWIVSFFSLFVFWSTLSMPLSKDPCFKTMRSLFWVVILYRETMTATPTQVRKQIHFSKCIFVFIFWLRRKHPHGYGSKTHIISSTSFFFTPLCHWNEGCRSDGETHKNLWCSATCCPIPVTSFWQGKKWSFLSLESYYYKVSLEKKADKKW